MLIQKYFETRLDLIEKGLDSFLSFEDKHASELKEAMRYAVIPGGKRWRPLMLLAVFEMLTGMKKTKVLNDAVLAAVAVELCHNAALIHDDLPSVKNNKLRRDIPAVHQKYGNAIAILAGDALYTLAFEVVGNISNKEHAIQATRILSSYTKSYGLIGGQMVDLEMKRKVMKINSLRFIDMKKVGALLQASADIACVLAEAEEEDRIVMNTYASNLALCYQMIENIASDYNRGGEGLDFDEEFVPSSRRTYTGILGFDKARSQVEKMLDDCERMLKPYSNRNVLDEFIQMLRDTLP